MATQYKGFDVLEVEPSFDEPTSKYTRSVYTLDSKTGKLRPTDRAGVSVVQPNSFHWVMDGRAEIQAYKDWLAARLGACVPCWVPSWRYDLPLYSDVAVSNPTILIQKIGYTKFMYPDVARRHIAVIMPDRTKYYREISSASEGVSNETIGIDSAVSVPIPSNSMVCFLSLCRLTDDSPELAWLSRDVAEVTLNFTELPFEVTA